MCTEDYSESQTLLLPKSCGEAPMGKKACRGHFSPTQFHFRLWPGHCWRKQKTGAQLYRSKRRRGNMVFQVSGWGVFSELTAPSRGRGECLFIDTETILVVNMKHLLYFQGRSLPRRRSAKEKPLMLHPLGRQGELIVTPNQFNQLESRTLNREMSAS